MCLGKSIRISLSDCKLCEQNNATVKHNCPKCNIYCRTYKLMNSSAFVAEFFTDGFSTVLYDSKYEAFKVKKFCDLQTDANEKQRTVANNR